MIFGRKQREEEDDDEDDEDVELVLFQGALNERDPNLKENAKLVRMGLVRAKELVSNALSRRAEMIRLDPKGSASVATFFVDGVPYPAERMPSNMGLAVTQMMKLLAGLDIKQRTQPQSGGLNAQYIETPYLLRVDSQPLPTGGERLIIRAQNKKIRLETPEDLGFSDELRQKIRDRTGNRFGVILAAGPPMSGVTTTSFAALRAVDGYMYTIYSLADMTGREVMHIKAFQGNPEDNFVQTVGRAKRAEGDVLYVNPLRTAEFAKEVLGEADEICFITEMAARDAADGIVRLREMVENAQMVAERVTLVLGQRLVRLLCTKCRQAYRPHPKLLAKVGLPPETKVLYRAYEASGNDDEEEEECKKCGGVGYFGRTGLIEAIEMTEGMKEVVLAGGDAAAIKTQSRKEKMQSTQSDGIRLVASGKTSLEELQRVFQARKG